MFARETSAPIKVMYVCFLVPLFEWSTDWSVGTGSSFSPKNSHHMPAYFPRLPLAQWPVLLACLPATACILIEKLMHGPSYVRKR